MKLYASRMLTDENIHPLVVQFLRRQGCDVEDVIGRGLAGAADDAVLADALKDARVVLTHDRDFGRLAILGRREMHGIIFLRPGHIDPQFTIATLETINAQELDLSPSFILVGRRRATQVQIRLRRW